MKKDEKYIIDMIKNLASLANETEWIEFKTDFYDPKAIAEYVSALSNSATLHAQNYAYMIWGVDDETHEIVGTNFNPNVKKVGNEEFQNWLFRMINPKINIKFYTVSINDKNVTLLEIPKARSEITKYGTAGFIRIGSVKKSLIDATSIEKELWKLLNYENFENSIGAENVTIENIFENLEYKEYFNLQNIPLPVNEHDIIHYLIQDNIIEKNDSGNYNITNLGLLLFAKNYRYFDNIKRKGIRIIKYNGNNKLETIDEIVVDSGLAFSFEKIITHVNNLIPKKEIIGQAFRKQSSEYPELSIREVIANSIVHQDFTTTGNSIMIEIYDGRIEVTNPGTPLIEIDRFLDNPPKSRNEELASFFRRIGICEERGSGFDKIVAESERYTLPAPKVDKYSENTKITLYFKKDYSDLLRDEKLRACYLHACFQYVNNDFLTNQSLRERFKIEQKNSATVSRLIKEAIEEQLIKPYEDNNASPKHNKYIPYWG